MALSFTTVFSFSPRQGVRSGFIDIVLDNQYAAGGWSVGAGDLGLGLNTLIYLDVPATDASGKYMFHWDPELGRLKAFTDFNVEAGLLEPGLNDIPLRCKYWGS